MDEKKYFGLGLRDLHYQEIAKKLPTEIDWFEIVSENYMISGGVPLYYLGKIKERYPIAMHGVSMSLGGTDPLNGEYLKKLKNLVSWVKPMWVSEHLCWTGVRGINTHDLLPLPYTEEALKHVVARISRVQEYLGQRLVIENLSSYISYNISEMTEWDFFAEVAKRADCYLLLDINNVFVSSINHDFDPKIYIDALPSARIKQYHLAGYTQLEHQIIDTHDAPVSKEVWDLYRYTLNKHGIRHVLIERDDQIPSLNELIYELNIAKELSFPCRREASV